MKSRHRRAVFTSAILPLLVLALMATGACSSSNDEAVDLLEDPKFGLAHLNDEFHTIKGGSSWATPRSGLPT